VYLGLDLIVSALWDNGRKLPWPELSVVLVSFGVGATFGFLEAIIVGLLAATLLFVVTYARLDMIRLRTDAKRVRSRVERGMEEQEILSRHGHLTRIYGLDGYVFFGTAHRLVAEIKERMNAVEPLSFIIIDFKRVRGLDASAAKAITRLVRMCELRGVELFWTGLSQTDAGLLCALDDEKHERPATLLETLHQALEVIEARLLREVPLSAARPGLLHTLLTQKVEENLADLVEEVTIGPGEELITQGAPADALFIITEGAAQAEVVDPSGRRLIVSGFQPGALVGEIGLYAGLPRTTRIVSPTGCKALRISADALDQLHAEFPSLAADIHRLIASNMARRLMRTTELLRDSDL
jgi:SulP family sulfate permease